MIPIKSLPHLSAQKSMPIPKPAGEPKNAKTPVTRSRRAANAPPQNGLATNAVLQPQRELVDQSA